MSLNYDFIFSQIDKAKKKRKRWTQADTDAWYKKREEEEKDKQPTATTREGKTVPGAGLRTGKMVDGKWQRSILTERTHRKTREQRKREKEAEKKAKLDKEKKDREDATITGVENDFPGKYHVTRGDKTKPKGKVIDMKIPKHIKGFGGDKQFHKEQVGTKIVDSAQPRDTKPRKPVNRKTAIRRQMGVYGGRKRGIDVEEHNRRLREADRLFARERNEDSLTSRADWEKHYKKNKEKLFQTYIKERKAAQEKRDADKKLREEIDPVTKKPRGAKNKPKSKKKKPDAATAADVAEAHSKMENDEDYQDHLDTQAEEYKGESKPETGDPNPDDEGPVYGEDYKNLGKSLWKSWLKNKEQEIVEVDGKTTLREKEPTIIEEKNRKFAKWKKQLEGTKDYLGQSAQKAWLEKKEMTDDEKEGQEVEDDIARKEKDRYDVALPRVGESDVPCSETGGEDCGGHHDTPSLLAFDIAEQRARGSKNPSYALENQKGYILPNLTENVINDKRDKLTNRGKALWKSWLEKKADAEDHPEMSPSEWLLWYKKQQKKKAEEGIGGMNMGSQRGLGHEAGYKQGSGQSAQITEVVEEEIGNESKKKSDIEKDGKNIHGFPHGKCTRCGHYMESEEYQTAEHSFNNPKEGEKVCNDCFDQEQSEFEGEEPKVFGNQSDSTISHTDPKKDKKKSHKCPKCESKDLVSAQHKSKKEKRGHNTKICDDCGHEWENKSGPENHEQDEGAEVKPNKQQIPPSKPGMDVIRSMYKKALITKYNNIYKPANL